VALEVATSDQITARGAGMTFLQGVADGPFGPTLLIWNQLGLAGLAFLAETDRAAALADLAGPWSRARFAADDKGAATQIASIFSTPIACSEDPIRLLVAGTEFQRMVWKALLRIPVSALITYEALGRAVGKPGAARAVGNAVGANPVSWVIPCHRVVRQTAVIGHYRWGSGVKRLLISVEASIAVPA
jgi:AraC family transcriptional regulator of adaptative response/methylated-DNA-[protein]-cysteine methyltransferase